MVRWLFADSNEQTIKKFLSQEIENFESRWVDFQPISLVLFHLIASFSVDFLSVVGAAVCITL